MGQALFNFLSKTKASVSRMEFVRNSIKFDHLFVVEAKGKVGELCILWKDGLSVKEVEYNKNLIAIKISNLACEWLMVGFYGPLYPLKKTKAWENLIATPPCSSCSSYSSPCVVPSTL